MIRLTLDKSSIDTFKKQESSYLTCCWTKVVCPTVGPLRGVVSLGALVAMARPTGAAAADLLMSRRLFCSVAQLLVVSSRRCFTPCHAHLLQTIHNALDQLPCNLFLHILINRRHIYIRRICKLMVY